MSVLLGFPDSPPVITINEVLSYSLDIGEYDLMNGTFVEQSTDNYVLLRQILLESGTVLPSPDCNILKARANDFPDIVSNNILNELSKVGLAVIQLDEPLSNERFTALGLLLGTPMPETDATVKPYVEQEVILNIVSEHENTSDVSLQPFATNFLTLHTESSGRLVEEQPQYIVLMCCDPGDNGTIAQTILAPMAAIEQSLTADEITLFAKTRYLRNHTGPSIVRYINGRCVFSFRDFHKQVLEWTYEGENGSANAINTALRNLLASMYAPGNATGVHWTRGMIVIINNTFFFHGRTAGVATISNTRRHLKRLRILSS